MPLFERIEYGSGHGTMQGIYPRFYLQIHEIADHCGKTKEEFDKIFGEYREKVMPDITNFYDLFHQIDDQYKKYNDGLRNEIYFSKDKQGTYNHDRKLEFQLINQIKDFFIKGRILLNNLSKSPILKDDLFNLELLLIVKDNNFIKNKNQLLDKDPLRRYEKLFEIVEDARAGFLNEFNQIRAEIEHNNFTINRFVIEILNGEIKVIEPCLGNDLLINKINFYYHQILRTIELLLVWFYGIQSYIKWKQFLVLYQRKSFDPKILYHEFVMLPRFPEDNMIQLLYP